MVYHTSKHQMVHMRGAWESSMVVFHFYVCVHGSNRSGASREKPSSYTWVCFCSSCTKENKNTACRSYPGTLDIKSCFLFLDLLVTKKSSQVWLHIADTYIQMYAWSLASWTAPRLMNIPKHISASLLVAFNKQQGSDRNACLKELKWRVGGMRVIGSLRIVILKGSKLFSWVMPISQWTSTDITGILLCWKVCNLCIYTVTHEP